MFTKIIERELEEKAIIVEYDFVLELAEEVINALRIFEANKTVKEGRVTMLSASKKGRYFMAVLDCFKECAVRGEQTSHGLSLDISEIEQDEFLDKLSEMKKEKNVEIIRETSEN